MEILSVMKVRPSLLRGVKAGRELMTTTRRCKPVARLTVVLPKGRVEFPDFAARARKNWRDPWRGASAEKLVDKSRLTVVAPTTPAKLQLQ